MWKSLAVTSLVIFLLLIWFQIERDLDFSNSLEQDAPISKASLLNTTPKTSRLTTSINESLFGNATLVKEQVEITKKLPETRLKLILSGTFTHKITAQASALISKNMTSNRYYIGDNIPGGAELVKVQVDSVILRRNGHDEILRFPRISDVPNKLNQYKQSPQSTSP
jgi:type II secretory pathway component PulC